MIAMIVDVGVVSLSESLGIKLSNMRYDMRYDIGTTFVQK